MELVKHRWMLKQQKSKVVLMSKMDKESHVQKPKKNVLQDTLALRGQWLLLLYDTGEYPAGQISLIHCLY